MAVNKIRRDEWIKALRPNPKDISDPYVVLEGYIGESSASGHIRVYADETLNDFIEVPESDIVYCSDLKDTALGGSKLWVNADAIYLFGDPKEKKRSKGSFLRGNLGGAQFPPPPPPPPTNQCTDRFRVCTFVTETVLDPGTRAINRTCYDGCTNQCTNPRSCLMVCTLMETVFQVRRPPNFNRFGGATGFEGFDPYQGL